MGTYFHPIVHIIFISCLTLAGIAYCIAALRRWRSLASDNGSDRLIGPVLAIGFAMLTAALISSLMDSSAREVSYAVLGAWAATAAVQFAFGVLMAPTRALLVLPVGCMAILVAMASIARPAQMADEGSRHGIVLVHSVLMASHLAVALVAGAAGGLYLVAAKQLKNAGTRALRLPPLPVLERVTERALVIATALLMVGLATGGAAIQVSSTVSLKHPSLIIAFVSLALLVLLFAVRLAGHGNRRVLALVAVQTMVLAGLAAAGLQVVSHG